MRREKRVVSGVKPRPIIDNLVSSFHQSIKRQDRRELSLLYSPPLRSFHSQFLEEEREVPGQIEFQKKWHHQLQISLSYGIAKGAAETYHQVDG